ncbi:ABC transporter permease subunit, partial [Brevundimonas sp.]|uniref:ABC transporter permease subunit n=1 Tax=Brevundimonas sp. TaxID=1871086 RepID=UPI00391B107C
MAALIALVPLIGVIAAALGTTDARFAPSDLIRYGLTSLGLLALVLPAVSILGSAAAWLVSLYRFPGRDLFLWMLAMPLALPAFALAYGYADLLDVGGPFRLWLRDAGLGWSGSIRNLWGAGLILTLAFYPYVYLTVRSALAAPAARTIEAARLLGASPIGLAIRVGLPLARPAIAAGAALAA